MNPSRPRYGASAGPPAEEHAFIEYQPIPRPPDAFQQPLTPDEIAVICRRTFGSGAQVTAAVELGGGMYNTTLRVHVTGEDRPVVLRVAPLPHKQFRSEHALMRNEFATLPYLAPIAPLMPRLIAADFTHEVIGRDVMVQTLLDGVPAAEQLGAYPRSTWPGFFRQLGEVARTVHAVRGPHFGPVAGPGHTTWSEALTDSFTSVVRGRLPENLRPYVRHPTDRVLRGPGARTKGCRPTLKAPQEVRSIRPARPARSGPCG